MLVVFLLAGAECGFSMDDRDEGDEIDDSILAILYSIGSVNAKRSSTVGRSDKLAMCFVHSSRILGVKSSKARATRYCERVAAFKSFIASYGRRIVCLSLVNPSRLKSNGSFTVVRWTWCG